MINFEKLQVKKVPLENKFDYRELFSDGKGVIIKLEYKQLISESIATNEVVIEKLFQENR